MTTSDEDRPIGYPFAVQATTTGYAAGGLQFGAIATAPTREKLQPLIEQQAALYLLDCHLDGRTADPPKLLEELDLSDYVGEGREPEIVFAHPAPMSAMSIAIEGALRDEGISYSELARRMGAPRSVVSRITDPFYFGHSARTLRRVAEALEREVHVSLETPTPRVEPRMVAL